MNPLFYLSCGQFCEGECDFFQFSEVVKESVVKGVKTFAIADMTSKVVCIVLTPARRASEDTSIIHVHANSGMPIRELKRKFVTGVIYSNYSNSSF